MFFLELPFFVCKTKLAFWISGRCFLSSSTSESGLSQHLSSPSVFLSKLLDVNSCLTPFAVLDVHITHSVVPQLLFKRSGSGMLLRSWLMKSLATCKPSKHLSLSSLLSQSDFSPLHATTSRNFEQLFASLMVVVALSPCYTKIALEVLIWRLLVDSTTDITHPLSWRCWEPDFDYTVVGVSAFEMKLKCIIIVLVRATFLSTFLSNAWIPCSLISTSLGWTRHRCFWLTGCAFKLQTCAEWWCAGSWCSAPSVRSLHLQCFI